MRRLLGLGLLVLALALAGCGEDADAGGKPELTVSAAASMQEALEACAPEYGAARVRLQFAGSDELAAQIRQGAPVDVFASANTKLPDALASEGELEQPVEFATNRLVLAVPSDSDIESVDALERPGVDVVIGAAGVPVGDYTRAVLEQLGPAQSKAILANVRSNEPDVKGVVGKLAQGAADAGFVYVTDVNATKGALRAIDLPADLDVSGTYGAGVVSDTNQPEAAQAFVDDLVGGGCQDALHAAGFGQP